MDDFRNLAGAVVIGNGFVVHTGWFYSHPAAAGDRSGPDSCDPRPKTSGLTAIDRSLAKRNSAGPVPALLHFYRMIVAGHFQVA